MANKLNKLLEKFNLNMDDEFDDDYYDDDDYADVENDRLSRQEDSRAEKEYRRQEKHTAKQESTSFSGFEDPAPAPKRSSFRTSSNKVVPIRTTPTGLEVCIIKPSNFGESQQVCEVLMDGQPVVVNLEGIDIMEAQRIMDFISGCIFSISGNMRQVSRYIFVFSPENIDISGDYIKSMAEGDGFNIPTLNKEF